MPEPQHLRVFMSSPGDVRDERNLARRLLKDELPYDPFLRGKVTLDPFSWDDPEAPTPMLATLTPQEAVNRFGCRPSECDIVIVVLWSRLGTHLKIDGTPYLSGTEYEYEDAVSAQKLPDILVYRRTERFLIDADDSQLDAKLAQRRKVQAFFDRFKNSDGSFRGSFTDYATPTEFARRLGKDLKFILQQRLETAAQRAPATAADVGPPQTSLPVWKHSPYPGLRPFDFAEAAIFFGRGRETDALIARLRNPDQRFLTVTGASGSGKSSLVRAGLLPRLLEGAIEGSQHWLEITFTPGAADKDPFLALAVELARKLPMSVQKPTIEIAEVLAHAPQRITDYAATVLAGRPAGAVLVLVVDQLEELFTPATTSHRAAPFLDLLARAAGDPRLRVLATLRGDFLSQAVAEPSLRPLLQAPAGTYPLASPDGLALAEMIRRPAERAGLEIEDDVVGELLKDAGTDLAGALPLVAFCLKELYSRTAPEHRLTVTAYESLGRLRGVIGQRATAILKDLRESEGTTLDNALEKMFRALLHIDAVGTTTRRPAFRDELSAEPLMLQLVTELEEGRLLVAEDTIGRATVTLAHDALIQVWPDLREWLERNSARMQRLHRWLSVLQDPDDARDRLHAIEALIDMQLVEAEVVEVVPALSDRARNDDAEEVCANAVRALERIERDAVLELPPQSLKRAALYWLTRERELGKVFLERLLRVREKDILLNPQRVTIDSKKSWFFSIARWFGLQLRDLSSCPAIIISYSSDFKVVRTYTGSYYGSGIPSIPSGGGIRRDVTDFEIEYYYLHSGKLSMGSKSGRRSGWVVAHSVGDEGVIIT